MPSASTRPRVKWPSRGSGGSRSLLRLHHSPQAGIWSGDGSRVAIAIDDLGELQERLRQFRDDRDWRQFHTLKDLAAAIAIEGAELQELFLWKQVEHEPGLVQGSRESIEDELADVMIQVLNFASVAGIDLLAAVNNKIDKNERRYPADAVRGSADKTRIE